MIHYIKKLTIHFEEYHQTINNYVDIVEYSNLS
jgi:hypothetical protein